MGEAIVARTSGVVAALLVFAMALGCTRATPTSEPAASEGTAVTQQPQEIQLPKPQTDGLVSVERAIATRRSVREFAAAPLTWAEMAQLAWAGQGITDAAGIRRAAPSAGALYPIELYLFTSEGVFRYVSKTHQAIRVATGDRRPALADAALGQESIRKAPCVIVLTAVVERMRPKYRDYTPRFIAIEAGHIAQNVLLQACALGLVAAPIGALADDKVARVLSLKPDEEPIYIMAIGRPAS
jgi:SagB-type dehydrogenase family enzyme